MVNKKTWLGILVMVLVFGMMVVGCWGNPEEDNDYTTLKLKNLSGQQLTVTEIHFSFKDFDVDSWDYTFNNTNIAWTGSQLINDGETKNFSFKWNYINRWGEPYDFCEEVFLKVEEGYEATPVFGSGKKTVYAISPAIGTAMSKGITRTMYIRWGRDGAYNKLQLFETEIGGNF
jgi:hypothetical protein